MKIKIIILNHGERVKLIVQFASFPLWHVSDLIAYRDTKLRLPPLAALSPDQTCPGLPPGFNVAVALCPPADSTRLGETPWS